MQSLEVIFFFYGAAFIGMGAIIFLMVKDRDFLGLFRNLWLVGVFGFLHGVNEWVDLLILMNLFNPPLLKILASILLPVSFVFLVLFASKVLSNIYTKAKMLNYLWIFCLLSWVLVFFFTKDLTIAGIWARNFICFPGTLLTAFAIFKNISKVKKNIRLPRLIILSTYCAVFAFVVYGILSGLFVPKSNFLLAGTINQDNFFEMFHMPVQFFRMICSGVLSVCFFLMVGLFSYDKGKVMLKGGIRRKMIFIFSLTGLVVTLLGISLGHFWVGSVMLKSLGSQQVKMAEILSVSIAKMFDQEIEQITAYSTAPILSKAIEEQNTKYKNMAQEQIFDYMSLMDKNWVSASDNSDFVKGLLSSPASLRLDNLKKIEENISEIFVTDRFGGLVASSGKTSDFYQADEHWWEYSFNGGKGRIFLGNVEFDESSKDWAIPLAMPIYDKENKLLGIMKAGISLKEFISSLEKFKIGETGFALLTDGQGYILYHPNYEPMSKEIITQKINSYFKDKKWAVVRGLYDDNKEYFLALADFSYPYFSDTRNTWKILVHQDAKEVLAPIRNFDWHIVQLMLVLFIFLMILAIMLSRIFAKPVQSLLVATQKIGQGDLDFKINIRTGDEIERYAESFKEMVANLKEKQKEILEAKNYSESIIGSLVDTLIVFDLNGFIMSANRATLDLLGYEEKEIVGKEIGKIIFKGERPVEKDFFNDLIRLNLIKHIEFVYVAKNDKRIPMSFSGSVMRSESGEIYGVLGIARDMRQINELIANLQETKEELEVLSKNLERKVEERTKDLGSVNEATLNILEDLQESKEIIVADKLRMESMVESMADGLVMFDDKEDKVVINGPAREIFGFGFSEVVSGVNLARKLKDIGLAEEVLECQRRKEPVLKEIILPQEESMILRCEIIPVNNAAKETVGILVVLRDITKEKEIDRMKTEFISTVSHELRTPLSITKEGISLVIDRIPGEINEKQESILVVAKDNIDRLARIINSLLDISKIEADKIEVRKEIFDIVPLIRQILFSFEPKAKTRNLELKTDFYAEKIEVFADLDKITQVFVNLIGNALKFTETGSITVGVKEFENEIQCFVLDTGIGIPKDGLHRVFNRFQQFGRTAGAGEKGTGLGLAIAKGLLELQGGRIWVESELGKGTKFTFVLPKKID